MAGERYIGLMSGTSADGIDAVVATFEQGRFVGVEASHHRPYPTALRESLLALGRSEQATVSLAALATLDAAVADQLGAAAQAVLAVAGLNPADICAIGSHGQTIFHDPKTAQSSLQLGDPSRIAAITGITVAADFRRMDVALGGQGAPLVPAFHQAIFQTEVPTAVVNLGGIANVTLLSAAADQPTLGFDCGPANALMDEWALRHCGRPYDALGAFAAQGAVVPALLQVWLAEPYFHLPPPKSTGRSLFNLEWADALAPGGLSAYAAHDVQASFCELTARSVASSIPVSTQRVLICGGGAFNAHLMARLTELVAPATISSTESAGLPPQWVEASAFAWLAHQRVHFLPGNLPAVTGAKRLAVLGGLFG